jgi:Flp pilus assembly pilin Flp
MTMQKQLEDFVSGEDGAITVDWVVLTASIVGLGIAAVTAITGNLDTVGDQVDNFLSSQTIATTF